MVLRTSSSVAADVSRREIVYDIPAAPLETALDAFAEASRLQVFYETTLTSGQRSKAVSGAYDPERALELLLQDTNLTAHVMGNGTVSLALAPVRGDRLVEMKRAVVRYYGAMQSDLLTALCRDARTRPGAYRAVLQYWIAPSGQVIEVRLIGSSGDGPRDDAILRAVRTVGFHVGFGAVPQPVTMAIEPDAGENGRLCTGSGQSDLAGGR